MFNYSFGPYPFGNTSSWTNVFFSFYAGNKEEARFCSNSHSCTHTPHTLSCWETYAAHHFSFSFSIVLCRNFQVLQVHVRVFLYTEFYIGLKQLEIPNTWFNPIIYWSGIRDLLFNLIIRMACLYIFNFLFLFWVEKLINHKAQNCLCLFMVVRAQSLRFSLLHSVFLLIFISRSSILQ